MSLRNRFAGTETLKKPEPLPVPSPLAQPAAVEIPALEKKDSIPSSRDGRRSVTAWITKEGAKTLKLIAVRNDKSLEKLMIEAVNDLLEKYGESRIA